MVQLSCSFATNCRTKCYFFRAGQGQQQLIPLDSWVYRLKKTFERRRCIPNMRFVREEAYSSAYWPNSTFHQEIVIEGYQYCTFLPRAFESLISESYTNFTLTVGCITVATYSNMSFKIFDSE